MDDDARGQGAGGSGLGGGHPEDVDVVATLVSPRVFGDVVAE